MLKNVNFKYVFKTALAGTVTAAIFMYFHMYNGQWAVMSTLLTMQSCKKSQTVESTLIAGFNRLAGALVGIAIGIIGFWSMNQVASDGYLWLILFVTFAALYLAILVNQQFNSLKLIPACTIMVMLMGLNRNTLSIAYERAYEVMLGVMVAVIINFIFRSRKQTNQLENTFMAFLKDSNLYWSYSMSKVLDVSKVKKRPSQKKLKNHIKDISEISTSYFIFFTDREILRKKQKIKHLSEQLTLTLAQINKIVNTIDNYALKEKNMALIKKLATEINSIWQPNSKKDDSEVIFSFKSTIGVKKIAGLVSDIKQTEVTKQVVLIHLLEQLKHIITRINKKKLARN